MASVAQILSMPTPVVSMSAQGTFCSVTPPRREPSLTLSSWNKQLAFSRGQSMGQEFRVKGVNVLLGPVVGPIGRVVRGGRNWEGLLTPPTCRV